MNIGELNRRIKILEFVEEKDEYGAIDGYWKEIATRWARIEQNGGSEQSDNNQVIARVSTKIIIRYYARLNEKHRIKYKDKLWQRSFYDHVIRDEKDYQKIWEYIDTNPQKWQEDKYYQ